VTTVIEVRSTSAHLYVGPLVSVITTLYYVAMIIFHCRVWYHALSLGHACIRCSRIILIPYATFVPNLVCFVDPIAELARGEKSCTQSINQSITHPAFLMPREPKLSLRNKNLTQIFCRCTCISETKLQGHVFQKLELKQDR